MPGNGSGHPGLPLELLEDELLEDELVDDEALVELDELDPPLPASPPVPPVPGGLCLLQISGRTG